MKQNTLTQEEAVAFSLRELYRGYGYKPFKMSKFEPYDLYAQNRSFMVCSNILTFTDGSGRLMALKPDVTLSIVKNYAGGQEKVYYNEHVYREGSGSHEFTEIMQVGLECIGQVDIYAQCETLLLARESLAKISPAYILDIASVGILRGLMAATDADDTVRLQLFALVQGKNVHHIRQLCEEQGISAMITEVWAKLATMYGPAKLLLPQLQELCLNREMTAAWAELSQICETLGPDGENLNLDFSIITDLEYYNGLVFKGYIQGLHSGVLSGGRYDTLLQKLGKQAQAIGFGVYLDLLQQLPAPAPAPDADILLTYGPETPAAQILAKAQELRQQGQAVRVCPSGSCAGCFGRTIQLG